MSTNEAATSRKVIRPLTAGQHGRSQPLCVVLNIWTNEQHTLPGTKEAEQPGPKKRGVKELKSNTAGIFLL